MPGAGDADARRGDAGGGGRAGQWARCRRAGVVVVAGGDALCADPARARLYGRGQCRRRTGFRGRRDRGKNKKKKREGNAEVLERLERLATATPPDAEPGAPIAPVHTNVTLTKADGSVHSQCKLQVNHLETATFVDDPNLKKALVRSPPLPTPPTPLHVAAVV